MKSPITRKEKESGKGFQDGTAPPSLSLFLFLAMTRAPLPRAWKTCCTTRITFSESAHEAASGGQRRNQTARPPQSKGWSIRDPQRSHCNKFSFTINFEQQLRFQAHLTDRVQEFLAIESLDGMVQLLWTGE